MSEAPQTHTEQPPGPSGVPVVHNTFQYADDPLEFIAGVARDYGPVAEYNIGGMSFYQVSDPELVEHVLVQENQKYIKGELFQDSLGTVLGEGLLTSEGEFWRQQRHLMQPAFLPQMLERYSEIMVEYTERMLSSWEDGETRDIHEDMMSLTVEIAAKTLFDVDIREEESAVGEALETVMDYSSVSMRRPVDVPQWVPTPLNRRYKQALEDLTEVVGRIIEDRRNGDGELDPESNDIVSLLLTFRDDDGNPLPDEQIRDELVTILLAGHETTALALTYTLHLLGTNQEQADTLREEVDSVLDGDSPTFADLGDLPYTEQVITEGMRIYPPVWELVREAAEPDTLGDYNIEPGQTVSAQQWVIHRDPRFYDDPLEFRPSRWTSEFKRDLPKFAYFPFGGGPRRCIGDRFALLEARLALATIAQSWTVDPTHELEFDPSITLRPEGTVEMVVNRR
ncbi:unspecific monooxygenase (cytochrome P450) [Haloferax elongans ATCC BAA-1513]|uniref:Unspecific monooxygenase (Cytochrome P450) n=1 Tax=Haloferax elongans ATCC BAA-1513 TaxID=1230453 RepID=M0HX00_HALEO|nr:cytochrome P450 [Haloferax elongans]ELZ88232.1 unspecific monooxygenase (cytochrome P450) [Haloferax elongans ATCC BAA-1513]